MRKLNTVVVMLAMLSVSSGVFAEGAAQEIVSRQTPSTTNVNNMSQGNIKAESDVAGSNNTVGVDAGMVSIKNTGGNVNVNNMHKGDVSAKSSIAGSNNKVDVRANAVRVENQ
jgi:hypothetical protein